MTKAKRLLVVGGTAGIGREVVKHYADRGWSVTLLAGTRLVRRP